MAQMMNYNLYSIVKGQTASPETQRSAWLDKCEDIIQVSGKRSSLNAFEKAWPVNMYFGVMTEMIA